MCCGFTLSINSYTFKRLILIIQLAGLSLLGQFVLCGFTFLGRFGGGFGIGNLGEGEAGGGAGEVQEGAADHAVQSELIIKIDFSAFNQIYFNIIGHMQIWLHQLDGSVQLRTLDSPQELL